MRQGTCSVPLDKFEGEKRVQDAVARLKEEEDRERGQQPQTVETVLSKLVCRDGSRIDDTLYNFVLLVDDVEGVDHFAEWMPKIRQVIPNLTVSLIIRLVIK